MAFLDNSGDIILDAVLTDTGRMRLAKGDGSFRISKFALGDDEIDYSLYDYNIVSGSAYYDLEILQTPVLEAFSNNASSMKSKLLSLAKNDAFYLPVIKINDAITAFNPAKSLINNGYVLVVDADTQTFINSATYDSVAVNTNGVLQGHITTNTAKFIQADQGIDSSEVSPLASLDPDLVESQYMIEIDNRIGSITGTDGMVQTPAYIDDDNIATYYFNTSDASIVMNNTSTMKAGEDNQVIAGSRGTMIKFRIRAQLDVSTTDYLFNEVGMSLSTGFATLDDIRGILTNVRVTGVTTGYSLDIPIMVVKKLN